MLASDINANDSSDSEDDDDDDESYESEDDESEDSEDDGSEKSVDPKKWNENPLLLKWRNVGTTIITNDNIRDFVKAYLRKNLSRKWKLPKDLAKTKIGDWDVKRVTNMDRLFKQVGIWAVRFNEPLDNWQVHNVTSMKEMFWGCPYDQPLHSWNTGSVKNMEGMFYANNSRYERIGFENWNVENVTNMARMFSNNMLLNNKSASVSGWVVKNVENMDEMFADSKRFNQPLNGWNVQNVKSMNGMFKECAVFNQPLDSWDVRKVRSMQDMFKKAKAFNQSLVTWKVNEGCNVNSIFKGATSMKSATWLNKMNTTLLSKLKKSVNLKDFKSFVVEEKARPPDEEATRDPIKPVNPYWLNEDYNKAKKNFTKKTLESFFKKELSKRGESKKTRRKSK